MKVIIIIEFCVAFLLMIVLDGVRTQWIIKVLDDMANKGEKINEIFTPSVNGFLVASHRRHMSHIHYKGLLRKDSVGLNKEVAMKFTPMETTLAPNTEYVMYTYLNAINTPNVTDYGIPCIYYYGEWSNHTMLALTLFDSTSPVINQVAEIEQTQLLVIFREFVRIIKYIHSQGVIHFNIRLENMLMQNGQGCITNFDISTEMDDWERRRNINYAKRDFEKFLWAVYELNSTQIREWFGFSDEDASRVQDTYNFLIVISEVTSENRGKRFNGLKRVIHEFGELALCHDIWQGRDANGNEITFYDRLYQVINEELNTFGAAPPSVPSLSHIPDPFRRVKRTRSRADYEYFDRIYSK